MIARMTVTDGQGELLPSKQDVVPIAKNSRLGALFQNPDIVTVAVTYDDGKTRTYTRQEE